MAPVICLAAAAAISLTSTTKIPTGLVAQERGCVYLNSALPIGLTSILDQYDLVQLLHVKALQEISWVIILLGKCLYFI